MIVPGLKPSVLLLGISASIGWSSTGFTMQAAGHHSLAGHSDRPAPMAAPTGQSFKAALTGATEVPGPGDPDGTGTATVTIDVMKNQLCYTLKVNKVEGVTMAHIHRAPMGSMGNVVVPLAAPTGGSSEGCVQIKQDLAAEIIAAPTDFYVNVHSQAHPAGAVRGQLGK